MNKQFGRLLLAGVCCMAAASAAPAQLWRQSNDDGDNSAHPSHRLLDGGVADLAGAEDQLAHRLQHTHDVQEMQDLAKRLLDNQDVRDILKQQIKDMKNGDIDDKIKDLKEAIQKNPQLLDDPKMHELLQEVEKAKKTGDLKDLSSETRKSVAKLLKNAYDKSQKSPDAGPGDPMTGLKDPTPPTNNSSPDAAKPSPAVTPPPPEKASQPSGWGHDLLHGMAGLAKDIGGTPEGEALRTEALRDIAKLESNSPGSSSRLTDFLKGAVSSDQASWLSQRWKTSSGAGLGGWNSGSVASALPSFGGSSDGMLDGVLWIAALALVIAAGWAAVAVARRQAGKTRARAWSPGPWPIRPSQVSTRQDLIRAFEHLAYLLLGLSARSLNHRDVAARLGRQDAGRAGAADRLAHLYEQARYAPPDEEMPPHELTAARGDLAALAGAAA